jgi:hypothetical protein
MIKRIWAIFVIRHNDLPSATRWPSPHSDLLLLIRLLLLPYLILLLFFLLLLVFRLVMRLVLFDIVLDLCYIPASSLSIFPFIRVLNFLVHPSILMVLFYRLQCIFAGQWTRYDVLPVHIQTADKVHQALFFPCLFIDLKAGVILARREAKVAGRSEAQG